MVLRFRRSSGRAARTGWGGGLAGVAAAAALLGPAAAGLAQTPTPLRTVRVISNIPNPVWVTAPRGDFDRLFVVQQGSANVGMVRLFDLRTSTLREEPFLTASVATGGERGLLGLAFHPDYLSNGYFWVHGTFGDEVRVYRYRAQGDPAAATAADPSSATLVLRTPGHPTVHHGGWMEFGPDGYLYISVGEGGVPSRSQNIVGDLSGKMLRIDVDGPDGIPGNEDDDQFPDDPDRHYSIPPDNPFVGLAGADEVWAYGLRNPWRNDIDPLTGEMFITDVGEGGWEEVNYQAPHVQGTLPGQPGYQGGRNYGWPCFEGPQPYFSDQCEPDTEVVFPIVAYHHTVPQPPVNVAGCAITGGVVYRGCAIPDLQGTYFFADFCTYKIFSFRQENGVPGEVTERTAELDPGDGLNIRFPTSFGRDAWGEVYICDWTGWEVFKIVPATMQDVNGDGIPDTCRCPADWNGDGQFNSADITAFLTTWLDAASGGPSTADYNADGMTNSADITAFLASWIAALSGGC